MKKHTYRFKGNLLYPVHEGYRAYIQSGDEFFCTSIVVDVLDNNENEIRFETVNSVYEVTLEKAFQAVV